MPNPKNNWRKKKKRTGTRRENQGWGEEKARKGEITAKEIDWIFTPRNRKNKQSYCTISPEDLKIRKRMQNLKNNLGTKKKIRRRKEK